MFYCSDIYGGEVCSVVLFAMFIFLRFVSRPDESSHFEICESRKLLKRQQTSCQHLHLMEHDLIGIGNIVTNNIDFGSFLHWLLEKYGIFAVNYWIGINIGCL